jgi:hypothetical protein
LIIRNILSGEKLLVESIVILIYKNTIIEKEKHIGFNEDFIFVNDLLNSNNLRLFIYYKSDLWNIFNRKKLFDLYINKIYNNPNNSFAEDIFISY